MTQVRDVDIDCLTFSPNHVLSKNGHFHSQNKNLQLKICSNLSSFLSFCNGRIRIRFQRHHSPVFCPKPNLSVKCSLYEGAPADDSSQNNGQDLESKGFWNEWKVNSAEMRSKLAKLGLAAVLAYGLFDGVTYTSFFVMAFLGYEKSTCKNPAANLQALLGIVILMWTGNYITRPFRVASAAALAPLIDKGLKKIQRYLNFPNLVYAFALVVFIVAASCLAVAGLLILSRWGK